MTQVWKPSQTQHGFMYELKLYFHVSTECFVWEIKMGKKSYCFFCSLESGEINEPKI